MENFATETPTSMSKFLCTNAHEQQERLDFTPCLDKIEPAGRVRPPRISMMRPFI